MNIYLSVSNATADLELHGELLKQMAPLSRRGHRVRSPLDISAGEDTRSLRLRMLAESDVILLLLSPDHAASPDLAAEADEALRHEKRRGAAVVPVILRALSGWEQEPYGQLAPLPADRRPVTLWPSRDQALCAVVDGLERILRGLQARSQLPASTDRLPPPAAAYDPAYYVPRPRDERNALRRLQGAGAAVVLQGPRGFGKATLLAHLLEHVAGRAVRLDLGALLDAGPVPDLSALLRGVAEHLARALLPQRVDVLDHVFARPGTDMGRLGHLMEQHLLPIGDPLVICLEQADLLHGHPGEQDFFAMLRGWAETSSGPWQRLRLLVTVATEPALLDSTDHSGFFVRATNIELPAMDRDQLGQMAQQYGFSNDDPGLDRVWRRTAGHPFLSRLWLYEAAMREVGPGDLQDKEVFSGHLRHLRRYMDEEQLWPALQQAIGGGEVEREEYGKLYSRGLLLEDDGVYRVRCPLYEDFVRKRWPSQH